MRTINEGFGTIYDRICKAEVIRALKEQENLETLTEVDVGIPILHSGGLALDSLLISDKFKRFTFVSPLDENVRYAKRFFPKAATYYSFNAFMDGEPEPTDLLFGNYIIEFAREIKQFMKIARRYKHILFFESNHHNMGHSLVKLVGRRFMIAPWVEYESLRETTPELAVKLLSELGVRNVSHGMIDFPFFAPTSGISPFKEMRSNRGDFSLQPLTARQQAFIRVGRSMEKSLLKPIMSQSHMFYVAGVP